MAENTTIAPLSLRVTRRFAAPRERVFRAFLETEAIRRWYAPPGATWPEPPRVDARPGGSYSFTVVHQGHRYTNYGTYLEVVPPERLVFTWRWDNAPVRGDSGDSLVTVTFGQSREDAAQTDVVLVHEKLPSEVARREHEGGWNGCLAAMAPLVEKEA